MQYIYSEHHAKVWLLRESLLIKHDKPILNRPIKSFLLELFDQGDSFISIYTWLSGSFKNIILKMHL